MASNGLYQVTLTAHELDLIIDGLELLMQASEDKTPGLFGLQLRFLLAKRRFDEPPEERTLDG